MHRVYVVRQQPARPQQQQQAEGGGGPSPGPGHSGVPTVLVPVGVITPTDILRLLLSGADGGSSSRN